MSVVVPYDPEWPAQFEAERRKLDVALRPWLVAGIEHIGSTSIVGMPAKPIIDMMAGVRDLSCATGAGDALLALGYHARPHRVDGALFVRTTSGSDPERADTHHLHLTTTDSWLWLERLAFREALRADERLVEEYAALKSELLLARQGRPYDGADKRAFVRRVLGAAGVELHDGLHSSH